MRTGQKLDLGEKFEIIDLNGGDLMNGDKVCILTSNQHYVVAEDGGGGALNANRRACYNWEQFTILRLDSSRRLQTPDQKIQSGDDIALQTNNGHYVVAEDGGGSVANANRTLVNNDGTWQIPGDWEVFTIIFQ